jgi:dTDP-4-dehydrorhamnose reductase
MRMLITGGSGFVGWNAVRYFVERHVDVVASYRSLPHYLQTFDGIHAVELDLTDGQAIDEVVARFQPAFILHTAAITRPQQAGTSSEFYRINVDATARLAEAAARHDAGLVYLSTDLVYPDDAGLVDERSAVAPSGAGDYSRSKLAAEQAIAATAARAIVVRPTLMFGDGPPRGNSFSMFIERTWAGGRPAPLFVDQYRSFLFVDDLLGAIEIVALRHQAWGELFVCGGPERLSRAEFGARYAAALGVDASMIAPMRARDLAGYTGGASDIAIDSSKLLALGWTHRTVEQGVRQMVARRPEPRPTNETESP